MTNWIINKGTGKVLEVIPKSQKDTLLDYYHYKKHFPCRITRNICKPLYFEKRLAIKSQINSYATSMEQTPISFKDPSLDYKFVVKIRWIVWIN